MSTATTVRIDENEDSIQYSTSASEFAIKRESYWRVTLEEENISIERSRKNCGQYNEYDLDLYEHIWKITVPANKCKPLSEFLDFLTPQEFVALAKRVTGAGWESIANEVCSKALRANLTLDYRYERYEGSGLFDNTKVATRASYEQDKGEFRFAGIHEDFLHNSQVDSVLSAHQMSSALQPYKTPSTQENLATLFSLNPRDLGELSGVIENLVSDKAQIERDFHCGTTEMAQNGSYFWLERMLTRRRRKK
jgi:hypothetical protein